MAMINPQFDSIGRQFVQHYYNTFDANRSTLGPLYAEQSLLSFEGEQFQGVAGIVNKLVSLPFQKIKHELVRADCQPNPQNNGVIVFVVVLMKSSPRHAPLPHITESHVVHSEDIDGTKSPHAIDDRDPNYDPFDEDSEYVDFYLNEENLGSIPYHVVQSTKISTTPAKVVNRFKMDTPELTLGQFKHRVDAILAELFTSRDFADCVNRIEALNCRMFHDELVAHVIRVSLDKDSDSDRDVVAALISLMRKSNHVSVGQLSRAFEKLFITWEDIKLDVPDAPQMILRFLELAVADGSVPSSFVARLPESFLLQLDQGSAAQPMHVLLGQLREFKKRVHSMVAPVLDPNFCLEDVVETVAAELGEAGHSEMRHEFVRRAINASLDREDQEREQVSLVLSLLRTRKFLSEDDFLWGFSHLLGSIDDLLIDCPSAVELVGKFLLRSVVDELIPPSFLENALRLGLGEASVSWAQARLEGRAWADVQVWVQSPRANKEAKKWLLELDVTISEFFDTKNSTVFCDIIHNWALTTPQAVRVAKECLLRAMRDGDGTACMAVVGLLEECVTREELKASDVWGAMKELDREKIQLATSIPDINEMLTVFGGLLKMRS